MNPMMQRRHGIIASSAVTAAPLTMWHDLFPWAHSWLADDLADGAVASWADAQAGLTFTQSTGTSQPIRAATSGANSQPAVTFDGVDDFLDAPGVSISQPDTIVVVGRYTGVKSQTSGYLIDGLTAVDRHLIGPSRGDDGNWWQYAGSVATTALAIDTAPHVIVAHFAGGSSWLRVGGVTAPTAPGTSNLTAGLRVGASFQGNTSTGLDIAAIGVASGDATSAPEWGALAALIDAKWGLTA